MWQTWSYGTRVPQDLARTIIVAAFDKLIHDLACTCSSADGARAAAALRYADWTVGEAFNAWYDEYMGGEIVA